MPCSGRCGESRCPEFCLCTEVSCGFNFALDAACLNFHSLLLIISLEFFLISSHSINSVQVFLCFANSVASTRFMLQDEFNIQTTKCDNCIIVLLFFSHKHTDTSYLCIFVSIIDSLYFFYTPHLDTLASFCRDLCSASSKWHAYSL